MRLQRSGSQGVSVACSVFETCHWVTVSTPALGLSLMHPSHGQSRAFLEVLNRGERKMERKKSKHGHWTHVVAPLLKHDSGVLWGEAAFEGCQEGEPLSGFGGECVHREVGTQLHPVLPKF